MVLIFVYHSMNMGQSGSKNPKINKDHNKQKMLKIGISVGRNDLNLEGHFQVGYHGKTVKNYKPVEEPIPENNVLEEPTSIVEE